MKRGGLMATDFLSDADRAEIRGVLLAQRAAGVECPMLPADVDVNGDGTADCYALDNLDDVVILPSVPIGDSLYESRGDDIGGGG